MQKKLILAFVVMFSATLKVIADEGMWLPLFLEGKTIQQMQIQGLQLTSEDLYSINKASLKDAIVIFGGGCTGELISDKGLVLTNHHCGLEYIQEHSSVENDLLKDGFIANSLNDELPNPDLKVRFLEYMQDVTADVLDGVSDDWEEIFRSEAINTNIRDIEQSLSDSGRYEVKVKPFFFGNQYIACIYKVFSDVRLVAAPPEFIGNFGGDTDNWMWPRHTADFSIFRIYADTANQPTEYSPDNIPYVPKKSLKISTTGISESDFTFVYGFPGRTNEYALSEEIRYLREEILPETIRLRTSRLLIIEEEMKKNPENRIKYTTKHNRISNSWKKWQGMIMGFDKLNTIEHKVAEEQKIQQWIINSSDSVKLKYVTIFDEFDSLYQRMNPLSLVKEFKYEVIYGIELFRYFRTVERYFENMSSDRNTSVHKAIIDETEKFYKDYLPIIDNKTIPILMKEYHEKTSIVYHPEVFEKINFSNSQATKDFFSKLYSKSIFSDPEKAKDIIFNWDKRTIRKIEGDELYRLYREFQFIYNYMIDPQLDVLYLNKDSLYRNYYRLLTTINSDSNYYPDANFTLRITYGHVKGYYPRDGVLYSHQTTSGGILEKSLLPVEDYQVPDDYLSKLEQKSQEPLSICFVASNHTTGGNSGSPVLDAHGHLVGLNFDRCWEGTLSDFDYDPLQCRNIAVDIKYILFVLKWLGDEDRLMEELKFVDL